MGALTAGLLLDLGAVLYVAPLLDEGIAFPAGPWRTIHFYVRIATMITFMLWTDRVYANLHGIDGQPEHSRVWAGLGFIVPPFCFFRPCQILLETWKTSATPSASRLMPVWIVTWWVLLMTAPIVTLTFGRVAEKERASRIFGGHVINVLAAVAALYIVYALTSEQRQTRSWLRREAANEERRMRAAAMTTALQQPQAAAAAQTPAAPAPAAVARQPLATPQARRVPPPGRPVSYAGRTVRRHSLMHQYLTVAEWLSALPVSLWRNAGASFVGLVAAAMLVAGAKVISQGVGDSWIVGGTHLSYGTILLVAWMLLRRSQIDRRENMRWMAIAAALAAISLLNLVILAGALSR